MIYVKHSLKLSILAFLILVVSSGFTNFSETSEENNIQGYWVYKTYKNGEYVYSKRSNFKDSKPGFKFDADGKMIKRMDPDWCARVKGPYTNLEGTYELVGSETLVTSYQCPISDEPSINKYKIIDLTSKKLVMKSMPVN